MRKRPTRYYSARQERKVAKVTGATLQPNSGATPFKKGDGVLRRLALLEMKTLLKAQTQHTIKKEWFDTVLKEALQAGKEFGVVVFDFGTQDDEQFAAIRLRDLVKLFEVYEEKEAE